MNYPNNVLLSVVPLHAIRACLFPSNNCDSADILAETINLGINQRNFTLIKQISYRYQHGNMSQLSVIKQ